MSDLLFETAEPSNPQEVTISPEIAERWYPLDLGDNVRAALLERIASPSQIEQGTLLFLHGRLTDSEAWRPLIKELPRFRCLNLELPGFADFAGKTSPIKRPLTLIEIVNLAALAIDRFVSEEKGVVIIGQDLGGLIAQFCALRCPRKVRGIVLLNSAYLGEKSVLRTGLGGWRVRRKVRALLRMAFPQKTASRNFLDRIWKSRSSRRARLAAIQAISDSWPGQFEQGFWRRELKRLGCPALLLWGDQDELNPVEKASQLMKELPDTDFFQEHCGHWPQLEKPKWVAEKIREFTFRKAQAGRSAA